MGKYIVDWIVGFEINDRLVVLLLLVVLFLLKSDFFFFLRFKMGNGLIMVGGLVLSRLLLSFFFCRLVVV